jgi:hypothetical protein
VQEDETGEMLPLTFLHRRSQVADAGFGRIVTSDIFQCTSEEVGEAISLGFGSGRRFHGSTGVVCVEASYSWWYSW